MKSFVCIVIFSVFIFSFIGCGEKPSKENFHEITSSTIKAVIVEMEDLGKGMSYYKVQVVGDAGSYRIFMNTHPSFYLGTNVRLYESGKYGFSSDGEYMYAITPE